MVFKKMFCGGWRYSVYHKDKRDQYRKVDMRSPEVEALLSQGTAIIKTEKKELS